MAGARVSGRVEKVGGSGFLRSVMASPLRAVVLLELAAIVAFGTLTAARLPVFSPIDEAAHFSYVQYVAEEHRLPVLRADKVSPEVLALQAGLYPETSGVRRPRGLANESYEAFQPPLYYLVAAPVFAITGNYRDKVTLLRLFDLALLLAAAVFMFKLARRAMEEEQLLAFGTGLLVLLTPGVLVRAVTVSTVALELLICCAFLYTLWRADDDGDGRRLALAGVLLGLALLTKLTLVFLVPLLLVVAVRHVRRVRTRATLVAAGLSLLLPLLLLAPWIAFNLHHYGSPTGAAIARDMQKPVIDKEGTGYRVAYLGRDLPVLPDHTALPEEWQLAASLRTATSRIVEALEFIEVAIVGPPLLLLLSAPRWRRSREAAFLLAPVALGVAALAIGSLVSDWPLVVPRYLFAVLPALAIFAALSWRRLLRGERAPLVLSMLCVLVLVGSWGHLAYEFLLSE